MEAGVTVKLTGIVTVLPPDGEIMMLPAYAVVEAARPDGFTVTVRLVGIVPVPLPLICSQFPPVVVVAEYVNMPPEGPLAAAM